MEDRQVRNSNIPPESGLLSSGWLPAESFTGREAIFDPAPSHRVTVTEWPGRTALLMPNVTVQQAPVQMRNLQRRGRHVVISTIQLICRETTNSTKEPQTAGEKFGRRDANRRAYRTHSHQIYQQKRMSPRESHLSPVRSRIICKNPQSAVYRRAIWNVILSAA